MALEVLGMSDTVPIYLKDLDARDKLILERRIDIEGGTEVSPLIVESLMARILCSYLSHGFLRSVDITQEIRSGGGRESCHELCGWG